MGYNIIFMSILALCACTIESKKSSSKKSSSEPSIITIYNNTTEPVLVFPIPENKPPYLLVRVPQQQAGVIVASGRISLPGDARAIIVVKESQSANFDQALQEAITQFNASKNKSTFSWEQSIDISLTKKGVSPHAWIIFYTTIHGDSNSLLLDAREYTLTLFNMILYGVPSTRMYGDVAVTKW